MGFRGNFSRKYLMFLEVLLLLKEEEKLVETLPYLLNYVITPWSRILLEKLTGFQLVRKFP
jgi:hypothetical protein